MNWFDVANSAFSFHIPVAAILCSLYLVPILRLVTMPISCSHGFLVHVSGTLGRWEHLIGWIRNWLGVPYLLCLLGWNIYSWIYTMQEQVWNQAAALAFGSLLLLIVGELYRAWKRNGILDLIDFAHRFPSIHPQDFFNYYYATLGFIRHKLPEAPHRVVDPTELDFRKSKQKKGYTILPVFEAVKNVMTITRLILHAEKWRGPAYAAEAASSLATVASARIIQLAQAHFRIDNLSALEKLDMPIIYCCNHTSAFDFFTLPMLLLSHRRIAGIDISNVPCFLLARDHFLENPILYRFLGLGRAAQILGMIFVERKKQSKSKAEEVVRTASESLLNGNIPIAIYPQGSRARGKFAADGTRLDAGYYTIGSIIRLKREGAHIKKGLSHIAVDTARMMESKGITGQVNLIPVAFIGAANVMPRQSLRVQRGVSVVIRVGDPLIVTTKMTEALNPSENENAYRELVDSLHNRIDQALKSTYRVHAELDRRFFEEIRGIIDPLRVEELAIAMKQWRREDYLIYVVLDYIYTSSSKNWRTLLGQLAHLILTDAPREDIVEFKNRIAETLPK